MKIEELKITMIEIEGELPSGCPWCPFDKLSASNEPCSVSGCAKSCYGYRPEGCRLVSVAEKPKE